MSERKTDRPRKCEVCGDTINTTSAGIKKHAAECKVLAEIAARVR